MGDPVTKDGPKGAGVSSPRLAGRATTEGTTRYAARHGGEGSGRVAYPKLGKTGLRVSAIGFGGYRVHDRDASHREALRAALLGGCNLVDTSTNYMGGGSERLVGATIAELVADGELARDELVVVSKAGYVQGELLDEARSREARGEGFPEVVHYSDDCWHCIAPEFLAEALARTLARTGLEQIDVYLLHNPEYFLLEAAEQGRLRGERPLEEARATFYDRVERAFVALEREVAAGTIGAYGVSSNTLPFGHATPTGVSFDPLLEAARRAARRVRGADVEPAFAVVQFPFNLIESEALEVQEGERMSLLWGCGVYDLGALINRPLNAILGNALLRFADRPYRADRDHDAAVERAVMRVLRAERGLLAGRPAERGRSVGGWLASHWRTIASHDHLDAIFERRLIPHLEDMTRFALERAAPSEREATREAVRGFRKALLGCARAMTERLNADAARQLEPWVQELNALLPDSWSEVPLARRALLFASSRLGVAAALNGMRRTAYVEDALAVIRAVARG